MTDITDHSQPDVFVVRHLHNAPREVVFACLTSPEHLTHFWGPTGTSTPSESIVVDLRPGGAFQTVMINDESGATHTMRAVYVSVDAPVSVTWRDLDTGVLTEVILIEHGVDETEVVTTQRGLPPHLRHPAARAGWQTALDKFAAYVAGRAAGDPADADNPRWGTDRP